MISSLVEGETNQGSNPGGIKKIPLLATHHPKNSGRVPVCGTYGCFGPPTRG